MTPESENYTTPQSNTRQQALLVLGMHRSGTSALTRLLNFCGAVLPEDLIDPEPESNSTGFWESRAFLALNDEILEAAGRSWNDLRPIPESWFGSAEAAAFVAKITVLLVQEFGATPFFVLKDPRLCLLLPLYRDALAKLGIGALAVVPVRNPLEVAGSLRSRDGIGEGKSLLLWLYHVLGAERQSRDMPRCFVTYEQLLTDASGTMARIAKTLGIGWPRAPEAAASEIAAFLSSGLRHQRRDEARFFADADVPSEVKDAYRWFLSAAEGAKLSAETLDDIQKQLDRAFPLFGGAIATLEAEAAHQRKALRHWVDAADERYAMIEHMRREIAMLQSKNELLAEHARIIETSTMWRAMSPVRALLRGLSPKPAKNSPAKPR